MWRKGSAGWNSNICCSRGYTAAPVALIVPVRAGGSQPQAV